MDARNPPSHQALSQHPEPSKLLAFPPRPSPDPTRWETVDGLGPSRQALDATHGGDELDPGTRRMCEILVDMAIRRLLARAAAPGTAGR